MSEKGWVKIHRGIRDSWLWDGEFSKGQAFVDLILIANHQDRKVMFNNEIILVKRGEKVTSIRKLAECITQTISNPL